MMSTEKLIDWEWLPEELFWNSWKAQLDFRYEISDLFLMVWKDLVCTVCQVNLKGRVNLERVCNC